MTSYYLLGFFGKLFKCELYTNSEERFIIERYMQQLSFSYQYDEGSLRTTLEDLSGKSLSLVITDNSTSMLYLKKKGKTVSIRIHRMFLSAGSEVIEDIARYIKSSRVKTPHIRAYIRQNAHQLKKTPSRKVSIKTTGERYDLLELFQLLNKEYFDGRVSAAITWGSKGPKRAAARRTLGSYCDSSNMIRINPLLDRKRVPRYFIEFIVYHEMLHADMGIRVNGGRRSLHSAEFKRREKIFRHYEKALEWEKKRW